MSAMTAYQAFAAGRLLLLLGLGGVLAWLAAGRDLSRRWRWLLPAIAFAAVIGYPNFGVFHPRQGPIHHWDAFHYFMGAKYFPELGYSYLYDATYVAGRELGAFANVRDLRDLKTYVRRDVRSIDAAAVRARFSPARWEAFKQDLMYFGPRVPEWPGPLLDHGYNDPPPRARLLHAIVGRLRATPWTLAVLTSVDYVVMVIAFVTLWRVFGALPTSIALAFFALSFFARFDFIGGSVLRWDWIAALLMAVAALARGRGVIAGLLIAYAVLARIFPIAFVLPLVVKAVQERAQGRRAPALTHCLVTTAVVIAVVLATLLATGESSTFTREYAAKIRLHNEAPSLNALGLGALVTVGTATWSQTPNGQIYMSEGAAMAARPARWLIALAAALYCALALPLVLRATPLMSLAYAVPLLFIALSLSGYYYSFLVLLILLPWSCAPVDRIRMIEMTLLVVVTAASYAFEVVSAELLTLYYQASLQIAIFFLLWLAFEYGHWFTLRAPRGSPQFARPEV